MSWKNLLNQYGVRASEAAASQPVIKLRNGRQRFGIVARRTGGIGVPLMRALRTQGTRHNSVLSVLLSSPVRPVAKGVATWGLRYDYLTVQDGGVMSVDVSDQSDEVRVWVTRNGLTQVHARVSDPAVMEGLLHNLVRAA
jgi:hypothetical protein